MARAGTRRVTGGLQLALALLLVAAAVSIWVMLENQSRRGGDVRDEASSLLSLIELQSTLAELNSAAADTAAMTAQGQEHAPEHPGLEDHDFARSLDHFDAELDGLRDASRSPDSLDEIASALARFESALDTLHDGADGADLMMLYHGSFQLAQADLEAAVRNMQILEGHSLADAIEVSAGADRWLRTLLPVIVLLAAAVAGSMLRVRRHRRLEQIEDLARQNQMKDDFIASVSHELRTPLTSIVGFLELVRTGEMQALDEQQTDLIGIAAQEAVDLANLVEDLLVIARLGAGGLVVASVPVSLRGQIAQVLESMIAVESVSVTGEASTVIADPARVRQILRNLLNNCLRYGGNRVFVRLGESGSRATLTVVDDGPGVPPDDRERIFEPYQRAHRSEGVTGSVGLGLAVSRHLAHMMGGDLRYVEDPIGAAFELSLPVLVDAAELPPAQSLPEADSRLR